MTEPTWTLPSDAAIKAILADRIDKERDGVGIVVGVIDETGRRVTAHGRFKRGGRRMVGGDTLFEIGSITKVFTSLLLSDMALRGEVALDAPAANCLPEGVAVPERGGRQITLADLATHTSGLPRMPTNFTRKQSGNPYEDYTVEQLYAFLGGHVLARDIGAQYEYSNLAVGLLGHALARRLGTDYESLVRARITGPLGLSDTAIRLSRGQRKRLAHGHDLGGRPVPNVDFREAFAGAGALRSTALDLLTFLAAELGYVETPLKRAMAAQRDFRRPTLPAGSVALGWGVAELPDAEIVRHIGGTGGYRSFVGADVKRGWGAVVLTNTRGGRVGDDIGMHILTGAPLVPAPAALLARIASNAPSPGTEDVLRRYIVSRANGQPNYDDLEPPLAEGARARWPSVEATIMARGTLQSITFVRVNTEGWDVYEAVYQNGRVEWSITPLGPNGKVSGMHRKAAP